MKLRIYIQSPFFNSKAFVVPHGYRFVYKCVDRFADEYWLFPFNYPVRAWYWLLRLYWKIIFKIVRFWYYLKRLMS